MKTKTPHNIQINDMKLILNTYVAFVVNKWIWHKCMPESDTLWSGTYSWGRAKIGKFCGNWERWGRRSATFHICRQSLQKEFKFYAKTFWSTGQPPHKEQGLRWNAQKTEVIRQYLSSDKTTWRVEYRVFHFSWRLSRPGFPRKQNSWKSILLILIWTKFSLIFVGHVEREGLKLDQILGLNRSARLNGDI